jgi:glucosamine--fructose-6-phosphate aminotransferase (isomerizing)
MHDAIYAQPGALRLVARDNAEALATAVARLGATRQIALAGIGTSWHAALVGEVLLASAGQFGHRARAYHSFELVNTWPQLDRDTGVIVVSHRGTKRYSLEAVQRAKAGGGLAVVITGKGSGDGLGVADVTLRTVEQEASAAHTIGYTCAVALLAALAAQLGDDADLLRGLEAVPDQVASLLGQEAWEDLAARFADRRRFYFIGGGPNAATAYEAALKMSEANHSTALGFHCEQFLHGPYAAMDRADVLVVIAPPGRAHDRCLTAVRAAREIGTPVVALVRDDEAEIARLAAETIALPDLPEALSPLLAVVPLQLFTYHLALVRGVNPDTMRGDQPDHGRARGLITL